METLFALIFISFWLGVLIFLSLKSKSKADLERERFLKSIERISDEIFNLGNRS